MKSSTRNSEAQPSRPGNWRRLQQVPDERPQFTVRLLRRLQYEGTIHVSKVGKLVFVDLDELDRLMAAHIVERP